MRFYFRNDTVSFEDYMVQPIDSRPSEKMSEFIPHFRLLQRSFLDKVRTNLIGIAAEDEYLITNWGDWHNFQCTCVCIGKKGNSVVYKPKNCEAEIFIQNALDLITGALPVNITIPRISAYNSFYLQEYSPQYISNPDLDLNYSLGALFAIGYWFGILDLHNKNISVNDKGIVLYDCDCLFHSTLGATFKERLNNIGLIRLDQDAIGKSGMNALTFDFIKSSILTGFSQSIKLLSSTPEYHYSLIDSIAARRLLLPTFEYIKIMRQRFLHGWNETTTVSKWLHFRQPNIKGSILGSKILEYELQCLLSWNVPLFYQIGDSLLSFDGTLLKGDLKKNSISMKRIHSELKKNQTRLALVLESLLEDFNDITGLIK